MRLAIIFVVPKKSPRHLTVTRALMMSDSFPGDLKFGKNFFSLNRRQALIEYIHLD
jgi:hypothetical protein